MSTALDGTVHPVPGDLRVVLEAEAGLLARWNALTPLGRNEFVCWLEDARRPATRARRIARTGEALVEGRKRPCCWPGCVHRDDKAPGAWQQAVLIEGRARRG